MEDIDQDYYNSIMVDSRNMTNKGKRTKRSRPSSPLTLTMGSTSSATTTAISIGGEDGGDHTNKPTNTFNMATTSSIEFTKLFREKEEKDMANCLILLAQGQSSPPPPPHTSVAVEVARGTGPGFYGYECKTCYRGFSSFQALGGHRASHKVKLCKPNHNSTTLSLQTGSNCSNQMSYCKPSGSIKATKIHECSTCGAEFGSGQALGGHMRRHRPMPVAITNCNGSGGCQESKKPKTLPSLDLNLPAPVEDDQRETNFPFRSTDRIITFSNSSLVHCHL